LKKSKEKAGEEYTYNPVLYSIKFTDKTGAYNSVYARDILDAIIKNYTIYYSENHLSQASFSQIDSDVKIGSHDYIEIAEVIKSNTGSIIQYLENKAGEDSSFRSPTTGFSFDDLSKKYTTIKQVDLPSVFSNILRGQVTQDKEVLLKKYEQKKDKLALTQQNEREKSDITSKLIDRFVESNKKAEAEQNDTKNSNNKNNVTSADSVYDANVSKAKTTYDDLMDKYVQSGVNGINAGIDTEYCDSVIKLFSAAPDPNIDAVKMKSVVESEINDISKKWSDLHTATIQTLSDYNSYVASKYITWLSGVNVTQVMSMKLYVGIAFAIGLTLGCVLAIGLEIVLEMNKKKKQQRLIELENEEDEEAEKVKESHNGENSEKIDSSEAKGTQDLENGHTGENV